MNSVNIFEVKIKKKKKKKKKKIEKCILKNIYHLTLYFIYIYIKQSSTFVFIY